MAPTLLQAPWAMLRVLDKSSVTWFAPHEVCSPSSSCAARPGLADAAATMITRLLGPSLLLSPPVPFQAPPRLSLVDDIRSSVQRRYRAEDVQRVLSAWDAMADGYVHEEELPGFEAEPMLRQQSNSYVDGLPIRLFYEEPARDFAWAQALEEHAHVVRDEFLSVTQSDAIEREGHDWTGLADIRDESTVAYGPEWRTLGLLDRGVWDPVNCRLFPKTVALLKESKTPCVEAFFAKMPAGTSIGAHSDGCNFHLTSHLGVDVPEGECWLQVRVRVRVRVRIRARARAMVRVS